MFTPLPLSFLAVTAVIVTVYVLTAEMAKSIFYRHLHDAEIGSRSA